MFRELRRKKNAVTDETAKELLKKCKKRCFSSYW